MACPKSRSISGRVHNAENPHEPPLEVNKRAARIAMGDEAIGNEDVPALKQYPAESDDRGPVATIPKGMTEFENPVAQSDTGVGIQRQVWIRARLEQSQ